MDVKKFVLSYYQNATDDFHINRLTAPKEALKLHSHSYFQLYYILSGRVIHHLESATAQLTPGDTFLLPPNLPHYIEVASTDVDFYSLSFMPDYFQSTKDSNKLIVDLLLHLQNQDAESIAPKVSLSYEDAAFSQAQLHRIFQEFIGNKPGKNELIKEAVSVLLTLLARVYFEKNAEALVAKENRQLVMYSIEYIKAHFDEEITLAEIIRRSAMSKTSFCGIFHSIVGMPFKEYLNRYRIERATELIASGQKISIVAGACGFNDFSTFFRNFKKYMGTSPSEFAARNAPK